MIEKITQSEIDKKSVASLPTRPNDPSAYGLGGLSSLKLRARFDALALLAIAKYNELVEAIGKEGADGLISMMPSGIEGKSLSELLSEIRTGDFSGILAAYDGEGSLTNLQAIITDVYEKLIEAGDGATFFPHIDGSGNLSWTNDKGHDNPDPINIMGSKLVRTEYKGKDSEGNNVYEQIYSDGTSAEITAPKGENGKDGLTPYIQDGIWWIGNSSTGVPASGGGGAVLHYESAVVKMGRYTGTGESEYESFVNKIHFFDTQFTPKFIFVIPKNNFGDGMYDCMLIACNDESYDPISVVTKIERGESYRSYANVEFGIDYVSWYAFDEYAQMNEAGKNYIYCAIGVYVPD